MKHRLFILLFALITSLIWSRQAFGQGPCPRPEVTYSPDFCVDGIYYKIVPGKMEVQLTRAEGSSKEVGPYNHETFVVPTSVSYNGSTYTVTIIGEGAFLEDTKLKKIILPDCITEFDNYSFAFSTLKDFNFPANLRKINDFAFQFCENLEDIVIPDHVLYIEYGAFCSCLNMKTFTFGRGLKQIKSNSLGSTRWVYPSQGAAGLWKYCTSTYLKYLYCLAKTPPVATDFASDYMDSYVTTPQHYYIYEDCILRVPVGSKELYATTGIWRWFQQIEEDPSLNSSISEISDDNEAIRIENGRIIGEGVLEVYDLGGREVCRGFFSDLPDLPAGFYIVRNDSTTAKIAIR